MKRSDKWLLGIISLSVFLTIAITAYQFLFKKDYDFVVEAACDPVENTCFYRDCSNPDDCPPNGLEQYRIFSMRASDFEKCSDNSCLVEITSGMVRGEEIICGESEEDECVSRE